MRWHLVAPGNAAPPPDSLLDTIDVKLQGALVRNVMARAIDHNSAGGPTNYGGRMTDRGFTIIPDEGQSGPLRTARGSFVPTADNCSVYTCGLQIAYRLEVRLDSKLLDRSLSCNAPIVLPSV